MARNCAQLPALSIKVGLQRCNALDGGLVSATAADSSTYDSDGEADQAESYSSCSTPHRHLCVLHLRPVVAAAGAMGVRTAHQVDPKAQLVVHTSSSAASNSSRSDQGEEVEVLDAMRLGNLAEPDELKGLTSASDVLSAPRLVGGPVGAKQGSLGGLQQAVLLGWAQQVKKGTSADELQVLSLPYTLQIKGNWVNDNQSFNVHVLLLLDTLILCALGTQQPL